MPPRWSSGEAFALGLPLSEAEGIQLGFIEGRVNPTRTMVQVNQPVNADQPEWVCFSEDVLTLATQCATHWDALAHASYGGVIYNGYPASTVSADGAARCGIHRLGTVVSRGVLLDVARALGRDVLEPGYPIMPDDLDAALRAGRRRVGAGRHRARADRPDGAPRSRARDLVAYTWPSPGLTIETAEWFHRHDVAAVATDTLVFEVYPSQHEDAYLPVHLLHLVEMGLTQGQNWVLDALAEDCAADGRYSFLLDATPLPLTQGLGHAAQPGGGEIAAGAGPARRGAAQHGARCAAVVRLPRRDLGRRRLPSGDGPVQHAGLGVDEVAASGSPRTRSRSGAPTRWRTWRRACRPRPWGRCRPVSTWRRSAAPSGEGEAVAITWASATVTALSARTRMPRSCPSPSSVARSTTRKTARLSSQ